MLHQELYNSALAQKKSAIEEGTKVPSFSQQCLELTRIRAQDPLMESVNAQSQQGTLKRLSLAFSKWHQRKKDKQPGGFPRFKSFERFKGFGYKSHGDGWKFTPGNKLSKRATQKHGRLFISGVGNITARGCPRNQGTPKTIDLTKKGDGWYASIVFDCSPKREKGEELATFDWGVLVFLVLVFGNGDVFEVPNPRITQRQLEKQRALDQSLARKNLGSNRRENAKKERAKFFQHQKNIRENFLHQISAALIALCAAIGTEELDLQKLTKKEAGKEALHREILSTGCGMLLAMLRYKASCTPRRSWGAIRRTSHQTTGPTQRCYQCWKKERKELDQRWHSCKCGANCSRDENAARVMMRALKELLSKTKSESKTGMESGRAEVSAITQLCETPSITPRVSVE